MRFPQLLAVADMADGEVGHGDERRRTAGPQASSLARGQVLAGSVRALLTRASTVLHVDARTFHLWSSSAQPTPPPTRAERLCVPAGVGVLKRLQDLGIDVPGDVTVVGFDDISAQTSAIRRSRLSPHRSSRSAVCADRPGPGHSRHSDRAAHRTARRAAGAGFNRSRQGGLSCSPVTVCAPRPFGINVFPERPVFSASIAPSGPRGRPARLPASPRRR